VCSAIFIVKERWQIQAFKEAIKELKNFCSLFSPFFGCFGLFLIGRVSPIKT
jgi:hypothetical protein